MYFALISSLRGLLSTGTCRTQVRAYRNCNMDLFVLLIINWRWLSWRCHCFVWERHRLDFSFAPIRVVTRTPDECQEPITIENEMTSPWRTITNCFLMLFPSGSLYVRTANFFATATNNICKTIDAHDGDYSDWIDWFDSREQIQPPTPQKKHERKITATKIIYPLQSHPSNKYKIKQ